MPEVIITYKKPETLKVLKSLAKYFDFKVSSAKQKKTEPYLIKGVMMIPPTEKFDNDDVTDLFEGIDAAKLRKEAWQRKL